MIKDRAAGYILSKIVYTAIVYTAEIAEAKRAEGFHVISHGILRHTNGDRTSHPGVQF